WNQRSVPVQWMTSFQVMLGAMIDSVLALSSQTRRKTGMKPKVSPSFGSVAYTGRGTTRVPRPLGHSAPAPAAAAGRRQPANRRARAPLIERGLRWESDDAPRRRHHSCFVVARSRMAAAVADDGAARARPPHRTRIHRRDRRTRRAAARPCLDRLAGTARSVQREDAALPAPVLPVHRHRRDLRLDAILLLAR